eukprot:gnl/MRDRNA2_/MRDRNA2_112555_c0_seq1.p1 gnl/MRDRNA2_/MRDRNA2_112555_c0~~gnl/MRDRNA2_/MRDRNA2_112555_c0_seq1.p1  ORF type:complete len:236 (+),score=46.89 gnl/MRDRNA2_/MRDRNA2_112555_c0_seq1:96-803(+)
MSGPVAKPILHQGLHGSHGALLKLNPHVSTPVYAPVAMPQAQEKAVENTDDSDDDVPSEPGDRPIQLTHDTNLSGAAVYKELRYALAHPGKGTALDLGAGAGFSSKILYELGYRDGIDSVDPSGEAWEMCRYAAELPNVTFYESTDADFVESNTHKQYDAINIAFGIATEKAEAIGMQHLKVGGRMLAPVSGGLCMVTYEKLEDGELSRVNSKWGWMWQPDTTSWRIWLRKLCHC